MSIHESPSNRATLSLLFSLFPKLNLSLNVDLRLSVCQQFSAHGRLSEVQIIQRLETHDFEVCVFVGVLYCVFVCVCV